MSGGGEEREDGRGSDGGEEWDEDLVLDERFIRDAEVSEPAARTRMLRERWRARPPEPQPWRAEGAPAGWFFSSARRKERRRRRRGRKDEDG